VLETRAEPRRPPGLYERQSLLQRRARHLELSQVELNLAQGAQQPPLAVACAHGTSQGHPLLGRGERLRGPSSKQAVVRQVVQRDRLPTRIAGLAEAGQGRAIVIDGPCGIPTVHGHNAQPKVCLAHGLPLLRALRQRTGLLEVRADRRGRRELPGAKGVGKDNVGARHQVRPLHQRLGGLQRGARVADGCTEGAHLSMALGQPKPHPGLRLGIARCLPIVERATIGGHPVLITRRVVRNAPQPLVHRTNLTARVVDGAPIEGHGVVIGIAPRSGVTGPHQPRERSDRVLCALKVLGHRRRHRIRIARGRRQALSRQPVELSAPHGGQRRVGHLNVAVVRRRKLAPSRRTGFHNQPCVQEHIECIERRPLLELSRLPQKREVSIAPDDRHQVEQAPRRARQPPQALLDDSAHRGRSSLCRRVGEPPAARRIDIELALLEHPLHRGKDKERVALGPGRHPLRELRERLPRQLAYEPGNGIRRQRTQGQRRQPPHALQRVQGVAERMIRRRLLAAGCQHDCQIGWQRWQQRKRRPVRAVRVVEEEDGTGWHTQRDQADQGRRQPRLRLTRRELGQHRERAGALSQLGEELVQRRPRRRRQVGGRRTRLNTGAQRAKERSVGQMLTPARACA